MAKNRTAAQIHTTSHLKRRVERLENRPMPKFEVGMSAMGSAATVMTCKDGNLYRIDADNGTIRKLSWEQ